MKGKVINIFLSTLGNLIGWSIKFIKYGFLAGVPLLVVYRILQGEYLEALYLTLVYMGAILCFLVSFFVEHVAIYKDVSTYSAY